MKWLKKEKKSGGNQEKNNESNCFLVMAVCMASGSYSLEESKNK